MAPTRPPGAFGLSQAQTGLWFAQQLHPGVPMTVALYLDLHGPIDIGRLDICGVRAGLELGSGSLRFGQASGQPYQLVDPGLKRALRVVDLRADPQPRAAALTWMERDHQAPLDVYGTDITLNVLFQTGPDEHLLYSRGHHLAVDGVGAINLLRRGADLYNGQPGTRAPATLADAIAAEQDYRQSPRFRTDAQFWASQLAGTRHTTSLALRQATPSLCPHRAETTVAPALMTWLAAAAERHHASLAELLIAAVGGYLSQMTGDDEVFVALPVAARTTATLRRSAGTFTNTVPLRLHTPAGLLVGELVTATRHTVVAALRHQLYRHEDMRTDVGIGARGIFGPLVNMVLSAPPVRLGGATGQVRLVSAGPVEDLLINFYRASPADPLTISVHANPGSYELSEAEHHQQAFVHYLGEFARAPAGTPLFRIAAPLAEVSHPLPLADKPTLPELFACPATGIVALQAADRTLSYPALEAVTSQWARVLIGLGAGPEDFVAIVMARSLESVIACRAVAKTGAAFVPIDPGQPAVRVAALLQQANVRAGLTLSTHRTDLPDGIVWLALDETPVHASTAPVTGKDRLRPLRPGNPAYLIYTSGSTGAPKGVVVSHTGLGVLTSYIRHAYRITADAVVLHAHSPAFDAALLELLSAAGGARQVVSPAAIVGGPPLRELLIAHRITHFLTTPAVLATLDPAALPALRTVVVGGEPCPDKLARQWGAHVALFNSFGLTETTIVVSQTPPLQPGAAVTIGTPLPEVTARVVDSLLRPVPLGGRGELYVAGPLLARGYLGQPGETATRFVASPFGTGERCYRTGDVVRQRRDGQLEFAGRSDSQLTLHGYRIEPAEVEAALEADPGVRQAIVSLTQGPAGAQLLAHVLPSSTDPFNTRAALARMRGLLPGAMVPAKIIVLESLPLTRNGKVDRAALPPGPVAAPYRAPVTTAERQVASIVGAALGQAKVGLDDEFFQLGGNSLLAVTVAGELAATTGAPVTVQWMFTNTTIAELAQTITDAQRGTNAATDAALGVTLWLRRSGTHAPLFCLHSAVPLSWCYAGLARYLDDRPLCGLQSPAILGGQQQPDIAELITTYADAIVEIQPRGPYHLLGWSFGGQLAHALAVRLRQRGAEVTLIMLDSLVFPPDMPDPPLPTMRDLLAHFTDADTASEVPADISASAAASWLADRPVGTLGKGLTALQLSRLYAGYVAGTLMSHEYRPATFDGDLLYFCATSGMTELVDAQIWRPYISGSIVEHPVATDHASLTTPAALAAIGPLVAQQLARDDEREQIAAAQQ